MRRQGRADFPPGKLTTQHDDHHITPLYTQVSKGTGQFARRFTNLGVSPPLLIPIVVDPKERQVCRLSLRPFINNVAGEIELIRKLPCKLSIGLLVIGHVELAGHLSSTSGWGERAGSHHNCKNANKKGSPHARTAALPT